MTEEGERPEFVSPNLWDALKKLEGSFNPNHFLITAKEVTPAEILACTVPDCFLGHFGFYGRDYADREVHVSYSPTGYQRGIASPYLEDKPCMQVWDDGTYTSEEREIAFPRLEMFLAEAFGGTRSGRHNIVYFVETLTKERLARGYAEVIASPLFRKTHSGISFAHVLPEFARDPALPPDKTEIRKYGS